MRSVVSSASSLGGFGSGIQSSTLSSTNPALAYLITLGDQRLHRSVEPRGVSGMVRHFLAVQRLKPIPLAHQRPPERMCRDHLVEPATPRRDQIQQAKAAPEIR